MHDGIPDPPADTAPTPGLARNIGAFFGHILKSIRTPVESPGANNARNIEIGRSVTEHTEGDVTIRETIIREVQVHPPKPTDRG